MFVYDGCYSPFRRRRHGSRVGTIDRTRFVVCVQNHDQVGNRALGDRFGAILPPAAQRLACGLLLVSPCVPLLFMGEEYGETAAVSVLLFVRRSRADRSGAARPARGVRRAGIPLESGNPRRPGSADVRRGQTELAMAGGLGGGSTPATL